MKLSLPTTVALLTFTGSVFASVNVVVKGGRGDKCGVSTDIANVNRQYECSTNLVCKEGYCDFPSYLSPDTAACIDLLKAQGFVGKLGDYALYGGYCYPASCTNMYGRINTCNNPKQACKDCQYCVDLRPSSTCVPKTRRKRPVVRNGNTSKVIMNTSPFNS